MHWSGADSRPEPSSRWPKCARIGCLEVVQKVLTFIIRPSISPLFFRKISKFKKEEEEKYSQHTAKIHDLPASEFERTFQYLFLFEYLSSLQERPPFFSGLPYWQPPAAARGTDIKRSDIKQSDISPIFGIGLKSV